MGRWTRGCADDGFDAVEYDNLDSFSRSHGLVTRADAKAYAALLVERAHAHGLAAGAEELGRVGRHAVGFDFASPSSARSTTSAAATSPTTASHVLAVEYGDKAFRRACRNWCDRIAVVRRDVDLTRHGVRRWC